jgi:predicted GIY-YIG superfamily endonuclease
MPPPTKEQIEAEIRRQRELYPPLSPAKSNTIEQPKLSQSKQMIHVWKLENECYFIGLSKTGKQARWINRHPIVGLVENISTKGMTAKQIEQEVKFLTLQYMKRYGWRTVRGGIFSCIGEARLEKLLQEENVLEKLNLYYVGRENLIAHKIHVYVLELEGGNYYIGQTKNLKRRTSQHISGSGALWTGLHKPTRLVAIDNAVYPSDSLAAKRETELTIEYMKKYGWQKVRGGAFCCLEEQELQVQLKNSGYFNEVTT